MTYYKIRSRMRQRILKKRQAEKRARIVNFLILIIMIIVGPGIYQRAMAEVSPTPTSALSYTGGEGANPEEVLADKPLATPDQPVEAPKKPDLSLKTPPGSEIEAYLVDTAISYKIDPVLFSKIAHCENTNLVPNLKNPIEGCTAGGIFQFIDSTWMSGIKRRGLNWTLADKYDYKKNIDMAAWFIAEGEISHWNASKNCWQ